MEVGIPISGVQQLPDDPCLIEIDDLVPLRFRSYRGPIGARYCQLGNGVSRLVELIVGPESRQLRGVTLTMFDRLVPWPELPPTPSLEGLPVLDLSWGAKRLIELPRDFTVAFANGRLLITWDRVAETQRRTTFGCVEFLMTDDQLVGLLVVGLGANEVRALESYTGRLIGSATRPTP